MQTEVVEEIKTHVLCSIFPPPPSENFAVREMQWKIIVDSRQATHDKTALSHCRLNTQSYKHTLRICNTYCFSTATMGARTRPNIAVYVLYIGCPVLFASALTSPLGTDLLLSPFLFLSAQPSIFL